MNATIDEPTGLIVASFGRQVIVENKQRERFNCLLKGRKIRPVCGDLVQWEAKDDDQIDGVVTAICTRKNELRRPTRRGGSELVASNLSQLLVVFADQPPADPFLVDRYIAAAEHVDIQCTLVKNKSDLGTSETPWLNELADLGYTVIQTSAKTKQGIDQLLSICAKGNNILVGQSGVGKSSLLNAMIPGIHQETQEISLSGKFGRHTTSASYLYRLENSDSGAVIDSPGVRDFAPPPLEEEQVASGFVEVHEAAQSCKFNNCRHQNEPHCAVKQAVENNHISERRYASYLQMLELMRELRQSNGPHRSD